MTRVWALLFSGLWPFARRNEAFMLNPAPWKEKILAALLHIFNPGRLLPTDPVDTARTVLVLWPAAPHPGRRVSFADQVGKPPTWADALF